MKRKLLGLLIVILLLAIVFSGCFEENKKTTSTVKPKTIYVDGSGGKNYTSIEDAVVAANPGDTVYVYNGTYLGYNIIIDKAINLIGEDKNTTIINGNGYKDALCIMADQVNISDFTIQNGGEYVYGIIIDSNYNSIINTTIILDNGEGNIFFTHSNNNVISGNILSNNKSYGLYFSSCNNNLVSDNKINSVGGIIFYSSSSNTVSGNTIINNTIIKNNENGIGLYLSSNNTISGNTINNNGEGAVFSDSNCNTVFDNTIENSGDGIGFYLSSSNTISGNTIINNSYDGIYFQNSSSNNTIYGNTIKNSNQTGINFLRFFSPSNGNIIYHNNLINNTLNANDTGNNTWYDITSETGNYWSDYEEKYPNAFQLNNYLVGLLWNTPYNITGGNNQDLYPLFAPFNI